MTEGNVTRYLFKTASVFAVSALTLSVSGTTRAYTFEVGDTTANIYGYARLDLIYDVHDKLGNAVNRHAIRLDGQQSADGHADIHAFQSRLGLSTSALVDGSELKTVVEGDFWGGGGGQLRLRHAYGEWKGILAGQTWTNFGNSLGYFRTVDLYYQPGVGTSKRQAQLRYTSGAFSFALENPETAGALPKASYSYASTGTIILDGVKSELTSQASADTAKSSLPDLTVRYQSSAGSLSYAASVVLRQLRYDASGQTSGPAVWNRDSSTGWGLNVGASAKVADGVSVRGGITHGDGIGSYLRLAPYASPAYVDNNGSLETIKGTGGVAGISMAAGKGNINLTYGIATVDLNDGVADGAISATANERFEGTYLNYIWSPSRNVTYGIEAGYHTRMQANGGNGHAVRFHGMMQYSF